MSRGNKTFKSKIFNTRQRKHWEKLICTLDIKARISKVNFSINFFVLGTLDKLIINFLSRGNKMTKKIWFVKKRAFLSLMNISNGLISTNELHSIIIGLIWIIFWWFLCEKTYFIDLSRGNKRPNIWFKRQKNHLRNF